MGRPHVQLQRSRRLSLHFRAVALNDRALAALRAVAATLVPAADPAVLAEQVAAKLAALPRAADRAELVQLLGMLEHRAANLLLGGGPRRLSAMPAAAREAYLGAWATSRLGVKRKAFQALKRLTTVTYYTAADRRAANPAWAGIGYPGPRGPAPATPRRITPLAIPEDTTLTCDAVVVGSGAGGGVVAAQLAARGKDVIVLEKGPYLNESDFSQLEGEMQGKAYDAGALLATDDLGMIILEGSCLGGGTVVNYTTSFHTPESVRAEWATQHGLPHYTSSEFTASLDAVARRICVNTDHNAPSARDRVLMRGLERCGWHHGLLPRDVKGCTQDDDCGYCGYGCRAGAKQSTLVTYLEDAATRGARVVVRADVRRVTIAGGRATGVEALVRDPDDRRARALSVRAKAVVVACGSIHSPALLLRSGLTLPALGRHLALHPATAVFADMGEPVRPWTGTVQAHYSDQFADLDRGYGFKFETAPVHPSLFALAVPWESGAQHAREMARLPTTTLVGILLRDRDGGHVHVDRDGNPVVRYRLSGYDARHLREGLVRAAELLEAAGAKEIWAPVARWTSYTPAPGARAHWVGDLDRGGLGVNQLLGVTFHQMASCRMGARRDSSVVNAENQVWDVPGLYVADASTFPTSSGVNPMLTIMGIAHRAGGIIAC